MAFRPDLLCRCGCGMGENPKHWSSALLAVLEALEHELIARGLKIIVTSGYRCPRYNRKVGGVPGSFHTTGEAVDVALPGGVGLDQLAHIAEQILHSRLPAGGLGVYENRRFIHIDTGDSPGVKPARRWRE